MRKLSAFEKKIVKTRKIKASTFLYYRSHPISDCADSTCMANRRGFCFKTRIGGWKGCNSIQRD